MTEALVREEIIGLLERLGSERDEEALEAAREVHERITAAGVAWNELLMPDQADKDGDDHRDPEDEDGDDHRDLEDKDGDDHRDPEDEDGDDHRDLEDEDGDDHRDLEDEDSMSHAERKKMNAESLSLIEKLLARSDLSGDMREELRGYKEDIAEGEFEERDRKYLRSLSERLSKRR